MEESTLRLDPTYDIDELVRESDRLRHSLRPDYKGL